MPEDSSAKMVSALHAASAYPEGYATKVELRETHISWVFLVDKHAFKLKKPVAFGEILDFSTREARLNYCNEELRLNRRLASDYYLGLAWVTNENKVVIQDVEPSSSAEPLVMMKRFPEENLLANLLDRNERISEKQLLQLAELLASLHEMAAPAPQFGTMDTIRFKWVENFETTAQHVEINERFKQSILAHIDANEDLFRERLENNRVRENHGDVQCFNIVLHAGTDGGPLLFDALEFNPMLRSGDVAEEIGFLTMDLKARNRYDLAALVLERYVEVSKDHRLLDVLPFYEAYRAYVRGKVAVFAASSMTDPIQKQKQLELADRYFMLAEESFSGTPRSV